MLGLLGLRIFEATGADIADLGEEHGHRILRVLGKGARVVLVPLPPAVGRAVDRAIGHRESGPILLNARGNRMDRHAATRRLRHLAAQAGVHLPRMHPHMLRHAVTTMLDAGVDLRDVQIAARHAGRAPQCATTGRGRTSIAIPTTSWPPTWPPARSGRWPGFLRRVSTYRPQGDRSWLPSVSRRPVSGLAVLIHGAGNGSKNGGGSARRRWA